MGTWRGEPEKFRLLRVQTDVVRANRLPGQTGDADRELKSLGRGRERHLHVDLIETGEGSLGAGVNRNETGELSDVDRHLGGEGNSKAGHINGNCASQSRGLRGTVYGAI